MTDRQEPEKRPSTDKGPTGKGPTRAEIELADELLRRTRGFLEKCMEDPGAAFRSEDPVVLSDKLYRLTHDVEDDTAAEPLDKMVNKTVNEKARGKVPEKNGPQADTGSHPRRPSKGKSKDQGKTHPTEPLVKQEDADEGEPPLKRRRSA